ncbi:MAG: lysylphosphatidylglycerol synthase transmembrane domain-containing protein [Oscillospiraceae bacterium]
MEKERRNHILGFAVFVLLMLVTGIVLFKGQNLGEIKAALLQASPIYLVLAFLMAVLFQVAEAVKIYMTINTMPVKVSFAKCLGYALIGFYFSSITPSSTGGQPAQIYYMKRDKINISYSSLTLLVLGFVHLATTLLFCGGLFALKFDFISEKIKGVEFLFAFGIVVNVIILALVFVAIFSKKAAFSVVNGCIKILAKIKILKNPEKSKSAAAEQIKEYSASATYLRQNPMLLARVFVVNFAQITVMFLVTYFIYKAFGLSEYSALEIVVLQAVTTVSVASLPLPGSVGASESVFMIIFKTLFGSALILPAMLFSRGISFYLILIISAAATIFIHFKGMNFHKKLAKNLSEKIS